MGNRFNDVRALFQFIILFDIEYVIVHANSVLIFHLDNLCHHPMLTYSLFILMTDFSFLHFSLFIYLDKTLFG